jgi:hypothetical protein
MNQLPSLLRNIFISKDYGVTCGYQFPVKWEIIFHYLPCSLIYVTNNTIITIKYM